MHENADAFNMGRATLQAESLLVFDGAYTGIAGAKPQTAEARESAMILGKKGNEV